MTIQLIKWGFKDAQGLIDPFVTVSVVDKLGAPLEPPQDTPYTNKHNAQYVTFDSKIHIQTPVNQLPEGSAVYLEFKHFKPKKQKVSTKAYCFMELDELRGGPAALEVYRKKPTDFKRKSKPELLSVKPLFLHLHLHIRTC